METKVYDYVRKTRENSNFYLFVFIYGDVKEKTNRNLQTMKIILFIITKILINL